MIGSTWGSVFRLTTFGESHGVGLGGIVDGCPAGVELDEAFIQERLNQRRPGLRGDAKSPEAMAGTKRKEPDLVRLLSGIFQGKTTGTPIAFLVLNQDQRSQDYDSLVQAYRPAHADMCYDVKYGLRDHRGGGRSSARETLSRVAGGAIAESLLAQSGIEVLAATVEVGGIALDPTLIDMQGAQGRAFFAAHESIIEPWGKRIMDVRNEGDTLGGIVRVVAKNVPCGLGEPVFQKLDAMLAAALMSVGAVKGVEIGSGFAAARALGSENNDALLAKDEKGKVLFATNNAGGILGGISSGQDIILQAAVKPIPSIARTQQTITSAGDSTELRVEGRHDICAIPRIVPVLKAMTALTLADALLQQRRMG